MKPRCPALLSLLLSAAILCSGSVRAEIPPGTPVVPDGWSNQSWLYSTTSLLSPVHGNSAHPACRVVTPDTATRVTNGEVIARSSAL